MQILDRQCLCLYTHSGGAKCVNKNYLTKRFFCFFRYELTKLGHISRICGGSGLKIFSCSNVLMINYFRGPKTSNPYINEGGSKNLNLHPGNSGTWKSSTVGILDHTIYYAKPSLKIRTVCAICWNYLGLSWKKNFANPQKISTHSAYSDMFYFQFFYWLSE